MWLVKNNVPYDVAFAMDDAERLAHAVTFARFEGNEFNWDTMTYRSRDA